MVHLNISTLRRDNKKKMFKQNTTSAHSFNADSEFIGARVQQQLGDKKASKKHLETQTPNPFKSRARVWLIFKPQFFKTINVNNMNKFGCKSEMAPETFFMILRPEKEQRVSYYKIITKRLDWKVIFQASGKFGNNSKGKSECQQGLCILPTGSRNNKVGLKWDLVQALYTSNSR